eukprot:4111108-Prorocentrum_lima.AAC.1
MTSSLVGSEMCIRDRGWRRREALIRDHGSGCGESMQLWTKALSSNPVSYTHLTLPTICSV